MITKKIAPIAGVKPQNSIQDFVLNCVKQSIGQSLIRRLIQMRTAKTKPTYVTDMDTKMSVNQAYIKITPEEFEKIKKYFKDVAKGLKGFKNRWVVVLGIKKLPKKEWHEEFVFDEY